ncbi:MAG: branched-chain amino acid transport system permease protein [Chloroflexota bacterium]|jgi:branched-chain amino acid transport system permease protein|nr:branched-chain amino acid transport system permease protein [Chloroflexota bacterium]
MKRERLMMPLLVILTTAALVLLPLDRSGGDISGTFDYVVQFGITFLIFAIMVIGLNIQLGYAGISNFGVAGFFLLGSYIAGLFVVPPATNQFVTYVGGFAKLFNPLPGLYTDQWLPFVAGTIAAGAACGILGGLLALLTPRLRFDYLAIATIGVAELLRAVATVQVGLVNGDRGLIGIPSPMQKLIPTDMYQIFLVVLLAVVLAVVYVAAERAVRSPWGRVLRALREDETATAAAGKNVFAFKTQAFILGAVIMGVAASFFTYYRRGLTPTDFEPLQGTFLFWVMLIVGGAGSNKGAIVGAYVVWGLWIASLQLTSYPMPEEISSRIPFVRFVLLGVFFVATLLVRPQGLVPEDRRVSRWVQRTVGRGGPLSTPAEPDTPDAVRP